MIGKRKPEGEPSSVAQPTVGRIVLFSYAEQTKLSPTARHGNSRTVPAIVTKPGNGLDVNVRVMVDNDAPPPWFPNVKHESEAGPSDHCWAWPLLK